MWKAEILLYHFQDKKLLPRWFRTLPRGISRKRQKQNSSQVNVGLYPRQHGQCRSRLLLFHPEHRCSTPSQQLVCGILQEQGWIIALLRLRSITKSCCSASCLLSHYVDKNGFSYNVLGQPTIQACANVIQILPKFQATVQMYPEFLWATLFPTMY